VVLVVPEIATDGHLLYEKRSLSSVSVLASTWFSVTHTAATSAAYHHPFTTEHVLNTITFPCHSEKTDQFFIISLGTVSQCNSTVKQGENLLYDCE
jgi:hypothetical protein